MKLESKGVSFMEFGRRQSRIAKSGARPKDVSVDVEGLPWTGIENSLNSPSNGPLLLGRFQICGEMGVSRVMGPILWMVFVRENPNLNG